MAGDNWSQRGNLRVASITMRAMLEVNHCDNSIKLLDYLKSVFFRYTIFSSAVMHAGHILLTVSNSVVNLYPFETLTSFERLPNCHAWKLGRPPGSFVDSKDRSRSRRT